MARIAFLSWDGGGNQPPAIGLAQELAGRGHEVRFIGFESQRQRLRGYGFELAVLATSDASFAAVPADQRLPAVMRLVWTSASQPSELAALLQAQPADLVVVDCLMFSALDAVRRLGVPAVSLFHSSPGSFVAMAEAGDGIGPPLMAAVNRIRSAAGLPAARTGWDLWSAQPTIVASIEELEPIGSSPPETFRYVGPLAPAIGVADEGQVPAGEGPLIVASLSTGVAFGDPLPRLQRIADAVASLDVRLLITCGPAADPAALRLPRNAAAVAFADHRLLMQRTALSINHAGHGTLSAALEAGVPILAMPNPMADQPYLAARITELGAGRQLGRDASSLEIAAAVSEMLDNRSYREAADRLSSSIASRPGAAGAAEWVESMIASGST